MTEAWSSSADSPLSPFGLPRTGSEVSDSELCARIRHHRPQSAGGRAAFGELYARHRLPALHFALRLNRNRARAEDAVAEAFAKIWRAWGRGKGPDESFKAYLMAAVRSESYRRTATTRATTAVEPDVLTFLADSEPSDHAAEVAERDQLGRAFRTLPDAWQSALTLIDIDGTPTSDAAESMELSPNSFSSLLRRAREGLRAAYLQEHVEPSPPECAEYASDLARFVRRQLSPKRTAAIEAHLSHCSHCRRQSFKLRSVNTTFQAWITPAVLAAALIELGHFPKGAVLLTGAGAANAESAAHSGIVGSETHSSALAGVSKSSTGAAAAGSSGGGTAGIAAGASALKIAVASIAATAAVAAGAVALVNLHNDPSPRSAAAAETSSAPAASPQSLPSPSSSPQASVPEDGSAGIRERRSAPDVERSDSRNEEGSQAPREDAQASTPEKETQPPVPRDRRQPTDEGAEQKPAEEPAAESEEPSSAPATESVESAPVEEPTDSSDPGQEPSSSPATPPEPDSDTAAEGTDDAVAGSDTEPAPEPSEPADETDAGAAAEGSAASDAAASDAADASDVDADAAAESSDGGEGHDGHHDDEGDGGRHGGEDDHDGMHCHDFGWWEYCH